MLGTFVQTINAQDKPANNQKFKLMFSERIRLTAVDNSVTLKNNTAPNVSTAWRTYLGFKYSPFNNFSILAQVANNAKFAFSPSSKKTGLNEIFVNQLYFSWKNIGNSPIDLTIGRQNMKFDESFICVDAQPLAGSRSIAFNAVRTDYHLDDKQVVTAFFSYNPTTDELLPIANEGEKPKKLEEQSNRAIGLYYQNRWKAKSKVSLYYFNKTTIANSKYPIELQRNAIGGRLALNFAEDWNLATEGAYQFGKTGDFNHSAYGGYAKLKRNFEGVPFLKQIMVGSFYYSGDDPTTDKTEGWDPLWSRMPKWSTSYIYTTIKETGKVAYWTNMASLFVGFTGKLSERAMLDVKYRYLLAPEDNATEFCSGDGKHRGNLFIIKAKYKIDEHFSGYFLWENFNAGNFYFDGAEGYNFARFQLLYRL